MENPQLVTLSWGRPRAAYVMVGAVVAGVLAVLLLAGGQRDASAQAPQDPPTIRSAEASDLETGAVVRVTGSGSFEIGFFLLQCAEGPTRLADCDQGTGTFANGFNEDTQTWTADMSVQRAIDPRSGTVDCAVDACEIALFESATRKVLSTVSMTFDPDKPAEDRPTASIRPRKNLVPNQQVTVKLTGVDPFESVRFRQCAINSLVAWTCSSVGSARAEVDGTAEGLVIARRYLGNQFDEATPDCLERRCVVVVSRPGRDTKPIQLKFDPDVPEPEGPTLKLSKRKGLVDGEVVKATVTFDPLGDNFSFFVLSQCAVGDNGYEACSYLAEVFNDIGDEDLDDGQSVKVKVMLRREIRSGHGQNIQVVDCAESSGRCVVVAQNGRNESASKALTFDPSVPAARPKVTLRKANKLVAGVSYDVKIENYLGSRVEVRQCPRSATSHEDHRCRRLGDERRGQQRTIEPFTVPITPVAEVGAEEVIDCYTKNACDLRVFGDEGPMQRILINFDSDQPSQSPSLTVKPSRALVDGQTVSLRGFNFNPDFELRMSICDQAQHRRCSNIGSDEVEWRNGVFRADVTVRRFIGTTDCADRGANCSIRVWNQDSQSAVVEVRFKRVEPAPVGFKVSPRRDLLDGQNVTVTATPEGPVAALRVRQCIAFDPDRPAREQRSRCSRAVSLTEADGVYTGEVEVFRAPRGVDCAESFGRCELEVLSAGTVRNSRPLGFRDEPLPEPLDFAMKVSPRKNLADGQVVAVEVSGVDNFYQVAQCAVIDGEFAPGSCRTFAYVNGPPTEVETIEVVVERNLMPQGAETSWDCALVEGSCVIALIDQRTDDPVRSVKLTFDPDAEPLQSTVSVSPNTGLVDGQEVTVTGEGWLPRAGVFILACVGDDERLGEEGINSCNVDDLHSVQVNDDGTFELTITVRVELLGEDCRVAHCRIGAGDAELRQTAGSERLMFS